MLFSCDDLDELAELAAGAWAAGADRDWSAPAGTLDWTCAATADHTVDTVFAPALFLASRNQSAYPSYGILTPGADAEPAVLVEALRTATRILTAVVAAAEPEATAVIWRRPQVQVRGRADFPPRAGLELALHAHDVSLGLGVPFEPPAALCDRLRRHTQRWPHWGAPGWSALRLEDEPWPDLLRASGRLAGHRAEAAQAQAVGDDKDR
jgi:hypothetical protein